MPHDHDRARRYRIRQDREMLLEFVNAAYPTPIDEDDILRAMMEVPEPVDEHNTRRDLALLADFGLIQRATDKHPVTGRPMRRWTLTARGVTFYEQGMPWEQLEGAQS